MSKRKVTRRPASARQAPSVAVQRRVKLAAQRAGVVEFVTAQGRRVDGGYDADLLERVAKRIGRSVQTIRRWIRQAAGPAPSSRPGPKPFQLTREHQKCIARKQSLLKGYDLAVSRGLVDPDKVSSTTFWRAYSKLPEARRQGLIHGTEEMPKHQVYNLRRVRRRNARWILDAMELPVLVFDRRGQRTRPYLLTVIDDATRVVIVSAVCMVASGEVVAAVLATALIGWTMPDGAFVGGQPEEIVWDNGNEFLNDHITAALIDLALFARANPIRHSWLNGKLERWHRTIQEELARELPGFRHGQKRRDGKHYTDTELDRLHSLERMQHAVNAWLEVYNRRKHSSLDDSPLGAWRANKTPIKPVVPERVALAFLKEGRAAVIGKAGIKFRKRLYIANALNEVYDRQVHIRYSGALPNYLAVVTADERVIIATWEELRTREEQTALAQQRTAEINEVDKLLREMRREQLAADAPEGRVVADRRTVPDRGTPAVPAATQSAVEAFFHHPPTLTDPSVGGTAA